MHHKIVLIVAQIVVAVGFRLHDFFLMRLWVAISFHMTDRLAAMFHYLCVSSHECNSDAFLEQIKPVLCTASGIVEILMTLADTKLESSKAYLIKYETVCRLALKL